MWRVSFEPFDEHRSAIVSTLFACGVRCPETARDLTQEVALRAWTKLGVLKDPRTFPAWVRRIAANAARDHLRRTAVRREDERSLRAETVREECAECTRWWNETFSGEAYDVVDGSVTAAISSFAPPARRRYRWLAAAAALVLAASVSVTSLLWRDDQTSPAISSEVVSTWDFEAGSLTATVPATGEATDASD